MTIEICEIHKGNQDLLQNLVSDVFDGPIIKSSYGEFIDDKRHHLIVATDKEADDRVVGMVSAFLYIHPDKTNQFFINELSVADSYLRLGIATQLMAKMLDKAKLLGCKEAWLATEKDNIVANRFYQSLNCVAEDCVAYHFDIK